MTNVLSRRALIGGILATTAGTAAHAACPKPGLNTDDRRPWPWHCKPELRPDPRNEVFRNDGRACFLRDTSGALQVNFGPFVGCRSSSCTRVIKAEVTVTIKPHNGQPAIWLESLFILQNTGGPICTMDCGGGGSARAAVPLVQDAVYPVLLGGKQIGTVDTAAIGTDPASTACVQSPPPS